MKRYRCLVMCVVVMAGASKAGAQILFQDNFEGYANQAAFEAVWQPIGCTGQGTSCTGNVSTLGGTWTTAQAATPTHSILNQSPVGSPGTSDSAQRNQTSFADTPALNNNVGADVVFSFDFYDLSPDSLPRQYANLQDTPSTATATNQLISMGVTNTLTTASDGGNFYMARILGYSPPAADPDGGPGNSLNTSGAYFKMNDTGVGLRSTGWHNLKVSISTDDGLSTDYKFYVDNVLAETVSNFGTTAQMRQYDTIRMGSGVSSAAADAYYDNMKVEFISSSVGLPGDFNNDNKVDLADAVIWRINEVANLPLPNDNGVGNQAARFSLWRGNFGNPGAGTGSAIDSTVPEPSTALFLFEAVVVLAIACWCCRSSRPRPRFRKVASVHTTCLVVARTGKGIVLAAVLCAFDSSVFAAPSVSVTKNFDTVVTGLPTQSNNYLDAFGNWVWKVQISPSNPIPTGTTSLAAEIGFTAGGVPTNETAALKGASNLSTGAGDDFDTIVPGTSIFGWETTGGVATNGRPEGLQTYCAVGCTTTGANNQVFSALLSQLYSTTGAKDYIQIKTRGPSAGVGGNLTSTLTMSGAYGGRARIAEATTGTPPSTNYDANFGPFTRTAVAGDANMSGAADDGDLSIVLTNLNNGSSTMKWFNGNFNNHSDNVVDDGDLNIMLTNLNISSGVIGNGAGGDLSGSAVPEPATWVLTALVVMIGQGLVGRKR